MQTYSRQEKFGSMLPNYEKNDSKNDEEREYDQDNARSAIFNYNHHPKTTDFMITLYLNQVCEKKERKKEKKQHSM